MKNSIALLLLTVVALTLVFVRCSNDNGFFGGSQGTPGFANGIFLDSNGNPVINGTLWVENSSTTMTTQGLGLVDNGVTCPDPTTAVLNGLEGCTNGNGTFVIDCTDNNGTFTVHTLDALGNSLGDGTITCGGVATVIGDGPAATPTPSSSPTP